MMVNRVVRIVLGGLVAAFMAVSQTGWGAPVAHNTDWFRDAKYGAFMHFLPGDDASFALIEKFDVQALANQLEEWARSIS